MKIIIAGGGTGGHLFPAVAVAEEMMRERPDTEIVFVGTSEGFEARWLPKSNYRYELFAVHGVRGRGLMARARSTAEFARAVVLARSSLARFGADLVLGVGGYASAPMGVAAKLSRVPLVLMEQNAVPGLANRILWRFADRICVGFRDCSRFFSTAKVAVTGNPVRFAAVPDHPLTDGQIQILVLGGSTGAHRLNIGVINAFKIWRNNVINLRLVHQTGEADVELARTEYDKFPFQAEAVPFIDDVAAALGRADLIVARAGAMTVSEIALAGRPAIFVPYPFHRDRQQEHNARVLERVGAAAIVHDDANLAANLLCKLEEFCSDRSKLAEMGRNARLAAAPDAAKKITQICFEIADARRVA